MKFMNKYVNGAAAVPLTLRVSAARYIRRAGWFGGRYSREEERSVRVRCFLSRA